MGSLMVAPSGPSKKLLLDQVRQAMTITTESTTNVTQAYEACEQWDTIMNNACKLPENIRGICFALQASCRARVGQDTLALASFQSCLNLKDYIQQDTIYEAAMGKAFALQRLMKYDDAHRAFLECDTERAYVGAITCLLRSCDYEGTEKVLGHFVERHPDSIDAQGLIGILLYVKATTQSEVNKAIEKLKLSRNKSPLFQWAYWMSLLENQQSQSLTKTTTTTTTTKIFDFLELISVNQSPFDDPFLIHLDDKVLLHDLLTNTTNTQSGDVAYFWPRGFILPRDLSIMKHHLTEGHNYGKMGKEWILKQRAGYGSHGNQLANKSQIMDLLENYAHESESCLCQHLVSPPLLLNGYKFTLRIYVVYFPGNQSPQVYIANKCLVKAASLPYDKDAANDERVHMTNSGREDKMGQYTLRVLESEFEKTGQWSYSDLWDDIREAVRVVMCTYLHFIQEQQNGHIITVEKLFIPKIMGFDFIVDANRRPFLLEVNRFPGLEPRDASDFSVKQAVVHGAWKLAGDRLGLGIARNHRLVDFVVEPCSFERLL